MLFGDWTGLSISLLVFIVGALLPIRQASAEVKTAQSGEVKAEISYGNQNHCVNNPSLKIVRRGRSEFDQPLKVNYICMILDLKLRDLDGNQEPEVILDAFTGGINCCWASLIYRYGGNRHGYILFEQQWAKARYTLEDLDKDSIPEFKSADARFAYQFSSGSGSAFPLQVWQFWQGRMRDVTRNYPQQIRGHAYQLWQKYLERQKQGSEVKGFLAAYLADKYLLGEAEDGWKRLQQTYREEDRQQFFTALYQFLQQNGYVAITTPQRLTAIAQRQFIPEHGFSER